MAGSIGPTGHLPASDDPTLGQDHLPRARRGLHRAGARPGRGRRRPDHHRDRAGHPRGQGRRLRRPRGVQADRPHACRSRPASRCCRTAARCCSAPTSRPCSTTLTALDVDVIGLNCSTGPEDMRDAIRYLGEISPLPVHCIPNAGLPLQGPDGETIFPEEPDPLANTLQEFVERYGVSIVGGCCGTTPEHIAAIVDRVGGREAGPRPERGRGAGLEHDDRHAARAGAAPDARRRARQLAGLAQGQGAAAGRRLRRAGAGRRGPGDGRRARARRLRRAHRAPGRGRADARGRQARSRSASPRRSRSTRPSRT